MPFTGSPVGSVQYTAQVASPITLDAGSVLGKVKRAFFSYTHTAGAGYGEVNLVKLPAGKKVIYPRSSWLSTSQFASASDLHIGFRAYTEPDGDVVAEDDNAFLDNGDAGGGALATALTAPTVGYLEVNSRGEFIIYAMVDTGNIEDTDTIAGYIDWADAS